MQYVHQYKLRPTESQAATLQRWLDMLKAQYNWMLADRFEWWQFNRSYINSCSLVQGPIQLRVNPDYYLQKRGLTQLKRERPWYKEVHSQVLQEVAKQVKTTFDRYVKGDKDGKRSGRPRFKGANRFRTFTYPQVKPDCIQGKRINLPKIGKVKIILHRPIPEGSTIKQVKVTRKADGWYALLILDDPTIPETTIEPTFENSVGIDVGLKEFLVTSEGESVPIPQYFRQSEQRLAKLQRQAARKQKFSNRWKKKQKQIAKLHLKISRQRKDFFSKVWDWLFSKYDVVIHEKLNIKGLARTRLAKSIHDAAWGTFFEMGRWKAKKAAKLTIAENPRGTSIDCSGCGERVEKTLADRVHRCPSCGLTMDRDHNAAINIKQRALGQSAPARLMSGSCAGVSEKPRSMRQHERREYVTRP